MFIENIDEGLGSVSFVVRTAIVAKLSSSCVVGGRWCLVGPEDDHDRGRTNRFVQTSRVDIYRHSFTDLSDHYIYGTGYRPGKPLTDLSSDPTRA